MGGSVTVTTRSEDVDHQSKVRGGLGTFLDETASEDFDLTKIRRGLGASLVERHRKVRAFWQHEISELVEVKALPVFPGNAKEVLKENSAPVDKLKSQALQDAKAPWE